MAERVSAYEAIKPMECEEEGKPTAAEVTARMNRNLNIYFTYYIIL